MNKKDINSTPSTNYIPDQPENAMELINKYGTYNIQPTADTVNKFPGIAQGLAKQVKEELSEEADKWQKRQNEKY